MRNDEHDPARCVICEFQGDWSTTGDTELWFALHTDAGFELQLARDGETKRQYIMEVKRPSG